MNQLRCNRETPCSDGTWWKDRMFVFHWSMPFLSYSSSKYPSKTAWWQPWQELDISGLFQYGDSVWHLAHWYFLTIEEPWSDVSDVWSTSAGLGCAIEISVEKRITTRKTWEREKRRFLSYCTHLNMDLYSIIFSKACSKHLYVRMERLYRGNRSMIVAVAIMGMMKVTINEKEIFDWDSLSLSYGFTLLYTLSHWFCMHCALQSVLGGHGSISISHGTLCVCLRSCSHVSWACFAIPNVHLGVQESPVWGGCVNPEIVYTTTHSCEDVQAR